MSLHSHPHMSRKWCDGLLMEVLLYFTVLPPENALRANREKNENTGLKEVLDFLLFITAQDGVDPCVVGGRVSC
jgi:hypothetical protein